MGHLTLGIESSCDETAVAIVKEGKEVLSNIIFSQIKEHKKYGGVVPEMASRLHVMNIIPCLEKAFLEANVSQKELDLVAITKGPGLLGAISTGVIAGKTLAYALDIPLIGVHHLEGHIYSNILDNNSDFIYPCLVLIASGGHTQLVLVSEPFSYQLIGNTLDDAIGEAFDKSARIIGLGYPGGPVIDKLAQQGNKSAYKFPSVKTANPLDFSFSGLKTSALNISKELNVLSLEKDSQIIKDFCASLQNGLIKELINNLSKASELYSVKQIIIAGGVSANSLLRQELKDNFHSYCTNISMPSLKYCTDNASMIACAGYYRFMNGETSSLDIEPKANISLFTN
jgi:N6-L-threonylcarbamoyladenine synthase